MFEYEDENEFEKLQEEIIDIYVTHDRSQLDGIYILKEKMGKVIHEECIYFRSVKYPTQ